MIGNVFKLASYTVLPSQAASFIVSTDAIDLTHSYKDQLGLWVKLHSYTGTCASPSVSIWYESSFRPDGDFKIPDGTNSVAITNSVANVFNLSSNWMPYIRLCAINASNTPSTFFSAYLFAQEDY